MWMSDVRENNNFCQRNERYGSSLCRLFNSLKAFSEFQFLLSSFFFFFFLLLSSSWNDIFIFAYSLPFTVINCILKYFYIYFGSSHHVSFNQQCSAVLSCAELYSALLSLILIGVYELYLAPKLSFAQNFFRFLYLRFAQAIA